MDPSLQAVLWDMDGTLVRTEELWMVAEQRTMLAFDSYWDAEDQAVAIGGPLDRVVTYMAQRVGLAEDVIGERLVHEIEALMRVEHVPWMPGAFELHDELTRARIGQGLVSNSWRELIDVALDELHTSFDVTIAGDEVERPKPDPQPYALACERLGASPSRTVVLEDSPTGVTAALAAGCWVVGIPHVSALPEHGRLVVVESLRDVSLGLLEGIVNPDTKSSSTSPIASS
jgi:HAD superfamily hydrolase (TIGR01509 family)